MYLNATPIAGIKPAWEEDIATAMSWFPYPVLNIPTYNLDSKTYNF